MSLCEKAVYDGMFGTPKTEAGSRQIPLSDTALQLVVEWRTHANNAKPEALVFCTRLGTPISPNNVRRSIFSVCDELGLPHATWLTFRRTYSSVARQRGAPQGGRATHGTRVRRHYAERVHAGARRVSTRGRRENRRRIVHNCSRRPRRPTRKLIERIGAPSTTRTCDLLVRSRQHFR